MNKIFPFALLISLCLSSCSQERSDKQFDQRTIQLHKNDLPANGTCQSVRKELDKYIDSHNEQLGNYSDSIFFVLNFFQTSDDDVEVFFNTSTMIPEIIDSLSVLSGHAKIKGKQIIVIDDKSLSNRKFYDCMDVHPITRDFKIEKSGLIYTELYQQKFKIKNSKLLPLE